MNFRYKWHIKGIRPFLGVFICIIKRIKSLCVPGKLKSLLSVIILLSGAMIVTGVFLQWFHLSMSVLGFKLSYSASGWDLAMRNSLLLKEFTYFSNKTFSQAFLVLSGGALIIVCTLCAVTIILVKKQWLIITSKIQGIVTVIAAAYSLGIVIWFLTSGSDMQKYFDNSYVSVDSGGLSYGFYVSTAFSLLALIAGIVMSVRVFRQTKHYNNKEGLLK